MACKLQTVFLSIGLNVFCCRLQAVRGAWDFLLEVVMVRILHLFPHVCCSLCCIIIIIIMFLNIIFDCFTKKTRIFRRHT